MLRLAALHRILFGRAEYKRRFLVTSSSFALTNALTTISRQLLSSPIVTSQSQKVQAQCFVPCLKGLSSNVLKQNFHVFPSSREISILLMRLPPPW